MRFATVCSGIGAPDLAARTLGFEHTFMAEIEPFPRAVLQHHFPEVRLYDDFTKINPKEWLGKLDCMVAGTPCQSFSVSGNRKGLADPRGNLTLEFVRLVQATECPWAILENVPGILSAGLGFVLGAITGREELCHIAKWPTCGLVQTGASGYAAGWAVLDAQNFGVPQRRRRVFIVASTRGWRSIARVLFEQTGSTGNTEESSVGEAVAGSTNRSPDATVYENHGTDSRIKELTGTAPTLLARMGTGDNNVPIVLAGNHANAEIGTNIAPTVVARAYKGPPLVITQKIRYLTHKEVERCFGFPDDWTAVPGWKKGKRYKALGNSMAVPVIRWLLERVDDNALLNPFLTGIID